VRWLLLLAFTACYSPRGYGHCSLACETGVCPGDIECKVALDQTMVCHAPNAAKCPGVIVDPDPDGGNTTGDAIADCYGHDVPPYLETCLSRDAATLTVPSRYTVSMPTTFTTTSECTPANGAYTILQKLVGPAVCVKVADDIEITSTGSLSARGGPVLLLLARNDITIDGTIDVSGSPLSPPAGTVNCPAGPGGDGPGGGSGGGGGSFATSGGTGGFGADNATRGTSTPIVTPINTVRGGCTGGLGGAPVSIVGGKGGGAIYLLAGHDIVINGHIDASGAGGAGGGSVSGAGGGGGGGGAGGMIVLEAKHAIAVAPTAEIFALGGGGGGGGSQDNPAMPGRPPTGPQTPGAGGPGGAVGVSGGFSGGSGGGGSRLSPADYVGQNGAFGRGGGGGGGGAGAIRINAPAMSGVTLMTVGPPPS
jgi:hypothetical protein